MRTSQALFLFLSPFTCLAARATPEAPTYLCRDAKGTEYRVWIGRANNRIEKTEGAAISVYPLASANIFRPAANPGEPLIYNGWQQGASRTAEAVDLAQEVVTQFKTDGEKSTLAFGLTLDHRERTPLDCTSSAQRAEIVYLAKHSAPEVRYPERVQAVAGLRGHDGGLTPVAARTLDSMVRRFYHSPSYADAAAKAAFIKNLTPGLVRVAPSTMSAVGKRLPDEMKPFWVAILDGTRYRYFPETERYAGWIKEGARPEPLRDLESVRAGFLSFVRSPLFKQKDLREFFSRAVTGAVASLEDFELNRVTARFHPNEKAYVKSVWVKATGKKTIDDFPEIMPMVEHLGKAVSAKEFDPLKVKDRLMVFFTTSMAGSADARALFVQASASHVKRLSPRQQEDVNAWLNDAGKTLFREMLR